MMFPCKWNIIMSLSLVFHDVPCQDCLLSRYSSGSQMQMYSFRAQQICWPWENFTPQDHGNTSVEIPKCRTLSTWVWDITTSRHLRYPRLFGTPTWDCQVPYYTIKNSCSSGASHWRSFREACSRWQETSVFRELNWVPHLESDSILWVHSFPYIDNSSRNVVSIEPGRCFWRKAVVKIQISLIWKMWSAHDKNIWIISFFFLEEFPCYYKTKFTIQMLFWFAVSGSVLESQRQSIKK